MSREPFCKTMKKKRGRPSLGGSGFLLDPEFDAEDVVDPTDYLLEDLLEKRRLRAEDGWPQE